MVLTILCLNPYYSGRGFLSYKEETAYYNRSVGLNPYYSGRGFLSIVNNSYRLDSPEVLILIILEEGSSAILISLKKLS